MKVDERAEEKQDVKEFAQLLKNLSPVQSSYIAGFIAASKLSETEKYLEESTA